MTSIASNLADPSFRAALAQLLALDAAVIGQLADIELTGSRDEDFSAAAAAGVPDESAFDVLSMLTFLQVNFGDSSQEVVSELGQVSPSYDEFEGIVTQDKLAVLGRAIRPNPGLRQELLRERVERGIFPVAEGLQVSLDLRVVPDGEGKLRLVPVAVGRMQFDEPVQVGEYISFQIPDDVLKQFKQAIDDTIDLRRRTESQFSEDLY